LKDYETVFIIANLNGRNVLPGVVDGLPGLEKVFEKKFRFKKKWKIIIHWRSNSIGSVRNNQPFFKKLMDKKFKKKVDTALMEKT
jgi:hypothetical protein